MDIIVELINKYNANIMFLFFGEGGMFRETDKEKEIETAEVPQDDWDEKDKLIWFIKNIPLIRYAMLEYFINYSFEKKGVMDNEIEKYRKSLEKETTN
jgi:hypothetical protein